MLLFVLQAYFLPIVPFPFKHLLVFHPCCQYHISSGLLNSHVDQTVQLGFYLDETPVYMNVRIFLLSMPNYHVLVGSLSFIAGVYIDQNYNVPDIKYWAKHIGDVVDSSYLDSYILVNLFGAEISQERAR